MTKREAVLSALLDHLAAVPDATVLREHVVPERIPPEGLIILRDGDPGEPQVILSPLIWLWEHRASIEVFAAGATPELRASAVDDLLAALGAALASDRTLGGLCDWVQSGAPSVEEIAEEGMRPIRAALVPVHLVYGSDDPLS